MDAPTVESIEAGIEAALGALESENTFREKEFWHSKISITPFLCGRDAYVCESVSE